MTVEDTSVQLCNFHAFLVYLSPKQEPIKWISLLRKHLSNTDSNMMKKNTTHSTSETNLAQVSPLFLLCPLFLQTVIDMVGYWLVRCNSHTLWVGISQICHWTDFFRSFVENQVWKKRTDTIGKAVKQWGISGDDRSTENEIFFVRFLISNCYKDHKHPVLKYWRQSLTLQNSIETKLEFRKSLLKIYCSFVCLDLLSDWRIWSITGLTTEILASTWLNIAQIIVYWESI